MTKSDLPPGVLDGVALPFQPPARELDIRRARDVWFDSSGGVMLVAFWLEPMCLIYLSDELVSLPVRERILKEYLVTMRAQAFTSVQWLGASHKRLHVLANTRRWKRINLRAREKRLAQVLL